MNSRTQKVASQIQQICAFTLRQSQLSHGSLLTIMGVDVPPHMRSATVFISVIGDSKSYEAEDLRLKLQEAVANELTSKFTPQLKLKFLDESPTA